MDTEVTVHLLFFAKARELANCSETSINLPREIVCSALSNIICETYNLTLIRQNIIVALNGDYCDNPEEILTLKQGDELAVIPPISGG